MSFDGKPNTRLPDEFQVGHEFAFTLHDVLLQQLHAGWRSNAWVEEVEVASPPQTGTLPEGAELVQWMVETQSPEKVAAFLTRTVYPFLLGDFLHFVYEALECSRKGKTTVAFALLRKPLQETLYVLELLSADPSGFASMFRADVGGLYPDKDPDRLVSAVRNAVDAAGARGEFNAEYIVKLRYSREDFDSFAGAFDQATHLVTRFRAIRTDALNFNFIFSDYESILSQWRFIYSRLPYLLAYVRRIAEHVFGRLGISDSAYMDDIDRRMLALTSLWYPGIEDRYRSAEIRAFVTHARSLLERLCLAGRWRTPTDEDLRRMAETGAWPGESARRVWARSLRYKALVKITAWLARH